MDQRTLLAISLSFLLLVSYQYYMDSNAVVQPAPQQIEQAQIDSTDLQTSKEPVPSLVDGVQVGKGISGPVLLEPAPAMMTPSNPIAKGERVKFENSLVRGEVDQTGARVASLSFLRHLDSLPPKGRPIQYINQDSREFFFSETGFLGAAGQDVPGRDTPWHLEGPDNLNGAGDLRFVWRNKQGISFEKTYSFKKDSYLFTVTDRVVNHSPQAIDLYHFAQFVRVKPTAGDGAPAMAIADFEGPMGFLDDVRVQHTYEDLQTADQRHKASRGWAGISDKFFLGALIPTDTVSNKNFYFDYDAPAHRAGLVSDKRMVESGHDLSIQTQLFIGPKEVKVLERQHLELNRAIDYGWFHFLAEPIVIVLLYLNSYFHNFGVAIILLTLSMKIILFPLANKSYVSMNAMKKLQPKIEELKKKHGDNKQALNEEMMKLYQTHKVNPLGGCLPIVIQIPVFFALYKVLFLSVEMRHAPFMLWIHDLSVMDPYYVLPILMGASMFFQSKLNPTPADPVQAKIMMFLPLIFTFMFLTFPAGLVLYWLLNNVLSIAQQMYILKKHPA
ncbi:MAG: membrane protein insertase YidC [Magnetococcales bacterium]|nr:membrane protein insertase YidC [Magnetococcales bacterium]